MKITFIRLLAVVLAGCVALVWGCTPKTGEAVKETKEKAEEVVVSTTGSKPDWGGLDIPKDGSVRTGTLANGMKYYIQRNIKPENRAELRLAVNAGAMQEDDDQQGLAHFVEHMCFNGTENFKKSELVDFLESIGTKFGPDLNAYTSFDETVYMLQVRTDDQSLFDKGMLILNDWAHAVSFEPEEIDKERGVVEGEWRSGLGANERMRDAYFPLIFKDSRYANRLPIGKVDILRNASYDKFTRFYKDWYRPDLMAVVVVGDIDVDQVEKQVKEQFSGLKNPDNPRKKQGNSVPKHKETLVAIASDKEAAQTQVQVLWKHNPMEMKNQKDYRQQMVNSLYSRMLNARLNELTQEANPPFLYGFSSYGGFVRGSDFYYSSAGVKGDGVLSGLEALLLENQRVLKHGFTATELDRAKKAMLNSVERQYKEADKTDSRRLAMRYVSNYLEGTPYPSPKQTFDMYSKYVPTITLPEINRMAAQWITDENRVVIVTGPDKPDVKLPTEAEIRSMLDKVGKTNVDAYVDQVTTSPLMSKKLTAKAISAEKKFDEIGVTELTLENGIKVVLKPTDFQNDQILMSAFSPGGHSLASDEDFMSASNASSIVNESGVGDFSSIELGKMMAGKTVSVSPYINELEEGMRGNCSPKDLETMMQMTYMYFTNPRKDEDALSSFMVKTKTQMQFMTSNPQFYFFDIITKEMSNNHPRRKIAPSNEDLDKIDLDKIMAFYKDRFADAGDFTFVFTGNFEVDKMKGMVAKYLGNLPTTGRKETWKDVGAETPKGKIEKTIKKGETAASFAFYAFDGEFDWDNAEERFDFKVMTEVMKIKLREQLREEQGGVYGVQVQPQLSRWPKEEFGVAIIFNAKPEEVDGLIDYAKKEIQKIQQNGPEAEDITKVTETLKQERIKKLKENGFWSSYLSQMYKNDLDPNKIQLKYLEEGIAKITPERIREMAVKVFDFNNDKTFILKPEK